MAKNSIIVFAFMFIGIITKAQKKPQFATELIPLVDSTINGFTNIYNFYPICYSQKQTVKFVQKILKAKSYKEQEKYLNKLLATRQPSTLCLLTFDYYFKNNKPVKGTNVEQFYNIIVAHDMYKKIVQTYNYPMYDTNSIFFKDSVQTKIGWIYGHGAYFYLSAEDSIYMAKMQKINPNKLDDKIEPIIENYVTQQEPIFKYNSTEIVKEIKAIPGIVNVIHDGCLSKTMQLPNWDNIYVVYVNGKDTLERKYTIEFSTSVSPLSYLRYLHLPIKANGHDYLYYKGASYVLHGYANTKKYCDINYEENRRSKQAYEEFLKNKK
jgi:hypothetical protein